MKKLKEKCLGIIAVSLNFLLILSVMAYTGGNKFALTASAAEESDKTTIDGLGTGSIGNPSTSGGGWSYVYYGNYNGSPVKYRVLDNDSSDFGGNTMLLDCDKMFQSYVFDEDGDSWSNSDLKDWLNGSDFLYDEDVFTELERGAIASSYKDSPSSSDGDGFRYKDENDELVNCDFQSLNGEKIFVLDSCETDNSSYGYTSGSYGKNQNGVSAGWWLRSTYSVSDNKLAIASQDGREGYDSLDGRHGISPAMNIELSSIISTSFISGSEYKLTIKDSNLGITADTITIEDGVVTVPYTITGSHADAANQVSVLIMDSQYQAGRSVTSGFTYAKLSVDSWGTSGTGTFTLPSQYLEKTCGSDYYVYILAEDVNSGKATDYASSPVAIQVPANTSSSSSSPRRNAPPRSNPNNNGAPTDPADPTNTADPTNNGNPTNSGNPSDPANSGVPSTTPGNSNTNNSNTNNSNTNNSNTNTSSSSSSRSSSSFSSRSSSSDSDSSNSAVTKVEEPVIVADFDYELRRKIEAAIKLGGEQTVTWNKGTALPYDIMKRLEDHPEITLIFSYTYGNVDYVVTIKGPKAYVTIPWYGPLYLYEHYGKTATPVVVCSATTCTEIPEVRTYTVVPGDYLTKIANELGVTVKYLAKKNHIKNWNLIYNGQLLEY